MAFTILNEADAFNTNQAEVDSVDITILVSALNGTAIVSGCAVTAQGSPNMTVAVASGVVIIAGTRASVTGANVTITTANGTHPRFDLIVSNGSGTLSAVAGTPAEEPVFPPIPGSSVVLAAVYVPAADTAIATNQITDKRLVVGNLLTPGFANANAWTGVQTLTSPVLNTGVSGTAILDEDNMATNSATQLATQQSIKAYVDAQIATENTLAEMDDVSLSTPTSAHVLIYDGSNSWDNKAVSGDITIGTTGVTAIGSGVVVNADVNASAAIDYSKLAALSDGNILVGNGSNVAVSVNPSGDVDVTNAGVFSIASDVVVDADIKSDAAIAMSKTALVAGTGITLATNTLNVDAAQSGITSLGTLTALQVDNVNINGNTISSTAGTDLLLTPLSGQQLVLDDTIIVDAGVVTGATSITSTAFVGALTGNASGTAATVTGATQAAITSAANLATVGTIGTGVWNGTALAQAYIGGEAINESKLQVSNGPTNGHLLTARDGVTGGFTWEAPAAGSDTTYSTSWVDSSADAILRLTPSSGSADDLTLVAGSNITLTPSGDNLTIAATDTDTNTTYTTSWVDSSADAILRLTPSSGSADDLTLVAGSNITLTPSGDNLTIAAASGGAQTPWTGNIDADTYTLTDVGATGNNWNSTALTVQSTTTAKLRLVVGSGDPVVIFEGPTNWGIGLDNSVSDQFVIGNDGTLGGADKLTIATGGDVTVSVGNLVIGTAGKGIDFSAQASPAAGMTSELLDRYEEGTWTAQIQGSTGSAGSAAYTGQGATYTRIGRMVTVYMSIRATNIGSWTGTMRITGLPFTNGGIGAAGSIGMLSSSALDATVRACHIPASAAYIEFKAGSYLDIGMNLSEYSTSYNTQVNVTYFV